MSRYRFGLGIHDVTGPAAECGMMGYAMLDQRTNGIHTRLRSRACIIGDESRRIGDESRRIGDESRRIVYVTVECGMIFQGVSLAVLENLHASYGDLYTAENVCVAATHTHSGPGGYSHYVLYNLMSLGYDRQNFEAIVDGICASIDKAHRNFEDSEPGTIRIVEGDVDNVGFNRSLQAYKLNPEQERLAYANDTNKTMTLLRFEDEHENEIGMLNWFAVHPTNVGNKNRLISSDNKGYAAYLFEKEKGTDYTKESTFISGFAQSECGDVSPNLWGYPDGKHDFLRMEDIGRRQFRAAKSLYNNAETVLEGKIDCRHRYLDMANINVDSQWIQEGETEAGEPVKTCTAAIGLSKIAGSEEDGRGPSFIHEGMTYKSVHLPDILVDAQEQKRHAEKSILFMTGKMKPYPWTPSVLPVQLLRIGQLGLIAMPAECTTMAARRLKNEVQREMPELEYLVIAGYANAYAGYITTREEYAAQHYEGASVHFGPYTLNAYQQEVSRLIRAMKTGSPTESAVQPENMRDRQTVRQPGVIIDAKPWFKAWGSVAVQPKTSYARDETVEVVFRGAHPKNNYMTQDSFLHVEQRIGDGWVSVARDWDPETVFKWERQGVAASKITVRWTIPMRARPGVYRIRHVGYRKGQKKYSVVSRSFQVL